MALMMGRLYDALKSANVPDDKARATAEEVASYDNRLARIESDLRVLKWSNGVILAGVAALIVRTFFGA